MEKKRVNLFFSSEVLKELEVLAKKYGMNKGSYIAYLVLKEKETEEREKQAFKAWKDNAKIWTSNPPF